MQIDAAQQPSMFREIRFSPAERRIFAKREPLTVSEWAEKYRTVPIGAHKGPWRNDISPHLVKIMDTWAQPHIREVIICKSPQTGGSEAMMNCVGYAMDRHPGMMMIIMPSEAMAKKVNADRIIPMILESPRLLSLISPDPDDMARLRIKLQNGTLLYMAWANSSSALATFPVRYLFFDETDKYPPFVGQETDPITLGEKRARTYRYTYKMFKVSTPTGEDGPIWKAWQAADVQYQYHVECPDCGEQQPMSIDGLKWPKTQSPLTLRGEADPPLKLRGGAEGGGVISPEDIRRENLAWYECRSCQAQWTDIIKEKAVRLGEWVTIKGEGIERPRSVAFHLPAWISPDISLSEIAATYLTAKKDRAKLIDFYNDYLAEPYVETIGGETASEDLIYQRRYQYWPDGAEWRIPMRASLLTCAVDVQQSPPRLEAEIVAWGEGYETWGIEYRVLAGDPTQEQVWKDLDEYLLREWPHESGVKMRISACAIDSGYLAPHVYRFVRPRQARRVYAVKGSNTRGKPLITMSGVRTSQVKKRKGVMLYIVGTETAKDVLLNWMQLDAPGPGYMHYHTGYDYGYFRQLTSEIGVTLYDRAGRPYREWRKKSSDARTEALDIRVYNLAALEILNPNFKALAHNIQKTETQKPAEQKPTEEKIISTKPTKRPLRNKNVGTWLNGWR